ncbi:MAG: hypothetical protein JSR46_03595 [Verrucomicrobia bacterium]|nr:hypothetical protein [Verrucomicrobiota bacterium]
MNTTLKLLFLALFQVANLFSIPQYQIIDLGLQQYTSTKVTSINDNGWVSGIIKDGGYTYIFVLDENKNLAKRAEKMFVRRPLINNSNEVFGTVIVWTGSGQWEFETDMVYKWTNPFSYFQCLYFQHLGLPWEHSWAYGINKDGNVWDINELGQILVMNSTSLTEAEDELFENKIWIYEGDDFYKIEDKNFTAGFKINNASQVLGSTVTGSVLDKNRMDKASVYDHKDKSIRIFDFPDRSVGTDINDNGQVVGTYYDPQEKIFEGFLADLSGNITKISNFEPDVISNRGEIIGTYIYGKKKDQLALWKDGTVTDLKEVVDLVDDQGNKWDSIDSIVACNNAGYLIGNGTINGHRHGFILAPIQK